MNKYQLPGQFLDQSKDLFWVVDLEYKLVYANKAYLRFMKEMTGTARKLDESAFIDSFGEKDIKKWKNYYTRALGGENFEIEEHFFNEKKNEIEYSQVAFDPLLDESDKLFGVACLSRNITRIVKQKSEANQIIDASLDVFCTINKQGHFVFVSGTSINLWGYTPEELIGTPYLHLVLEEDHQKTNDKTNSIKSGEQTKSFINRYRKKDGSIAYNHWSARWDSATNLTYCVARDAKESIEQEEKLSRSEQRFKALVQEGMDLYAIIDLQGRYTYMSPSSTAITGIPPEGFIGRDAFEFIHPEDIEKTLSGLKKVAKEDKVVMELYRAKNQNNEWRWVETVLTNMLDNPAVNGIVVNSRDITKEIEEKQQLKLLESVITNTNDAILITEAEPFDEPGPKILYVNEAFTKMTGYEAEEVIGKTPRILQGPNSDKEELAKLGQALRNYESHEITTLNYKKSGAEFWVNFTVTPVANEKGWYTHWIAIERDVTEQKNKERETDLVNSIIDIFHQSIDNNLTKCLSETCELISRFGEFDFAEIWLPSIDFKSINRVANHSKGKVGSDFYKATRQVASCALGEGLPGDVWKNKTIKVWGIVEGKWLFERNSAANKSGIETMMGVPLKHKDVVIGVLLLGTEKTKSTLIQYIDLFQKLELTIGNELSRKKVEIELAQIFDFTPDLICMAGFDGYIKRINPAGLAILGYSLEEIRSRPINSFIHEDDRFLTRDNQMKLYSGENLQSFENRYITKEGNVVWLSWTSTSSPEQGIVYAVAKNITEEKNLRELNRQVGKLAKIGSWEVDTVNNTVYWSDEIHKIFGTNPKSFVPNVECAFNFYKEDYRHLARSNFEKCIATQEPYTIEAVIVNSSNKEIWVQTTAKAEFVDGICTRVYGSFQDIDDRKQSEIRLQSLASNLPGVIFQYIIKPDGTDSLKYVTEGSQTVWGFSCDEVIQDNQLVWNSIKAGGEFEKVQKSISDSIEFKTKWTCRYKYVMPSGELRTHLGNGTPTFLTDGTILFNSIILDVTQETQNEELLNQTTQIARIGSWEMDLINQEGDSIYWSPMLREIVEVESDYNPTLNGGIELHIGESKERIKNALDCLMHEGTEFDEEILLQTAKGNQRWFRAIGKKEMAKNKVTKIYGSYQDIHEQKTARLELEKSLKSLENYKYSLDQSAIIAFTDSKGVITSVNDNFCKISKFPKEEIIGKTHRLINSKHHPKEFFNQLWNTIGSGKVWRGEIKNRAKDNSYYWVDTTIVPFLDAKNKPLQFLAIRFDITERKKAEQEKNDLQATIENSLNEIYIFNSKTFKFSFVNKGALLNLGYSEKEIKALTPLDIKPEFTEASFKKLVSQLVLNEKSKIVFFTNHQRKDGSLYPVEVHLQLVTENDKRRYLAVILDITERKKAEEENKFKANLLSMIGQSAIATNLEGVVNYWNKTAENMYGWKAEETIGKNIINLTPLETNQEEANNILDVLRKGQTWTGEFYVKRKDGTNFPVRISNSPIYDENNNLSGIIGISSDITQEVKSEELLKQYTLELERSNEELEQFAFVASHDLQEPLRMVSSFMDLLQRKFGDQLDEKGNQYIYFAADGAKRMKQIILDLLEYSRASRPTEGKEDVDLNEVISEYTNLRSSLISESSATIKYKDLPTLFTYKAAIVQVFHCLIDNALKYSALDTEPIVEINSKENNNEWTFSIKDNGIGIDPQFHEKIFVIFQRLHNKEEYEGTGIGLSIAKRHVELVGGKIWLKSALKTGSTFHFTIPKTKKHEK